jgi:hypothetical protein
MLKHLPVMLEARTDNLNSLDLKKSVYFPRAMNLMTLIKLVKLFVLKVSPTHYHSPTLVLSNKTPCSSEVECLVAAVSVTLETTNSNSLLPNTVSNDIQQHVISVNSGDADNVSQSDCHSDSCAPEVMVPDARGFSSIKNEHKYPKLYDSVVHRM